MLGISIYPMKHNISYAELKSCFKIIYDTTPPTMTITSTTSGVTDDSTTNDSSFNLFINNFKYYVQAIFKGLCYWLQKIIYYCFIIFDCLKFVLLIKGI